MCVASQFLTLAKTKHKPEKIHKITVYLDIIAIYCLLVNSELDEIL